MFRLAGSVRNISLQATKQPLSTELLKKIHQQVGQLMLALPKDDEQPAIGVPLLLELKRTEALQGLHKLSMPPQPARLLSRKALVEQYSDDAPLPPPTSEKCCTFCGVTSTPEWRRGPAGRKTLCNACGLHYSKLSSKRKGKGTKKKSSKTSY